MFKITRDKRTSLEREIDSVLEVMSLYKPDAEEYKTMADNLEKLYKAKVHEHDRRISPDTMLVVAGNLLGIALIMHYEQVNVITTKALGFVIKGRV